MKFKLVEEMQVELKESSVIKDSKNIGPKEMLSLGGDKADGGYVDKLYFTGPDVDMYGREFRKIFNTEAEARKYFNRYK